MFHVVIVYGPGDVTILHGLVQQVRAVVSPVRSQTQSGGGAVRSGRNGCSYWKESWGKYKNSISLFTTTRWFTGPESRWAARWRFEPTARCSVKVKTLLGSVLFLLVAWLKCEARVTLGGNQTFSSVVVIMEVRVGIGEELVAAAVKQPCKTISVVISWLLNVGAQCLGVFFLGRIRDGSTLNIRRRASIRRLNHILVLTLLLQHVDSYESIWRKEEEPLCLWIKVFKNIHQQNTLSVSVVVTSHVVHIYPWNFIKYSMSWLTKFG